VHPPKPIPDELSAPFWDGVRRGRLMIQRCGDCRRYCYPPVARCTACLSERVLFEQVSGRGRVYCYSETVSGVRHPYFAAIAPYLVGLVELEEQQGLLMCTNFPGATLEELSVDAEVAVEFQEIASRAAIIPQFRLARGT
jgi:uncharacterized OB-fold protein